MRNKVIYYILIKMIEDNAEKNSNELCMIDSLPFDFNSFNSLIYTPQLNSNLTIFTPGCTYLKIMNYYKDEKDRFEGVDFTFQEMEDFIYEYYDSKATMKIKILESFDSSLFIGMLYYINISIRGELPYSSLCLHA